MPNIDTRISWGATFYQGDIEVLPGFFFKIMGNPLISTAVYTVIAISLCCLLIEGLRWGFHDWLPAHFARPGYTRSYYSGSLLRGYPRWVDGRLGAMVVDMTAMPYERATFGSVARDLTGPDLSYRGRVDREVEAWVRDAYMEDPIL